MLNNLTGAAVLIALMTLSGCAADAPTPEGTGVLILACSGKWGGTDTPERPMTREYRVNFETQIVEASDVRLGTWHAQLGERAFKADDRTISYDGREPHMPALPDSSTFYTLQFDRRSGRVVDGARMLDLSSGGQIEAVEEFFVGTCEAKHEPPIQNKF